MPRTFTLKAMEFMELLHGLHGLHGERSVRSLRSNATQRLRSHAGVPRAFTMKLMELVELLFMGSMFSMVNAQSALPCQQSDAAILTTRSQTKSFHHEGQKITKLFWKSSSKRVFQSVRRASTG